MSMKPWFPTFIYESRLQRAGIGDLARALVADCRDVREQDPEGQLWCQDSYPGGYTSYGTRRDLHQTLPKFRELEAQIWPHVQRFADGLDMDLTEANLAMTDCWVNIMTAGGTHRLHAHAGAVVSGTLYVSTPPGCSGLRFEDPRLEKKVNTPPRRTASRPPNHERVTYAAEEGKLILFESWLRHEVVTNPTADERVSISFNYTWV
jgi:uncharacterized protein (TIGR02466 family)